MHNKFNYNKNLVLEIGKKQIQYGKEISQSFKESIEKYVYISPLGELFVKISIDDIEDEEKEILDKYFSIQIGKDNTIKAGSRGYGYYMMFGKHFVINDHKDGYNNTNFNNLKLGSTFFKEFLNYREDMKKISHIKGIRSIIVDNLRSHILCLINLITVFLNPHVIKKYEDHSEKIKDDNYLQIIQSELNSIYNLYEILVQQYKSYFLDPENFNITESLITEGIEKLVDVSKVIFGTSLMIRKKSYTISTMLDKYSAFSDIFFKKLLRNFREEDNPLLIYNTISKFIDQCPNFDKKKTILLGLQYGGIECGMIGSILGMQYGVVFFSKYFANNYKEFCRLSTIPMMIKESKNKLNLDYEANHNLIKNNNVLIVDDNISSGASLNAIRNILDAHGALSSQILAIRFQTLDQEDGKKIRENYELLPIIGNVTSKSYYRLPSKMINTRADGTTSYRNLLIEKKKNELERSFGRYVRNF